MASDMVVASTSEPYEAVHKAMRDFLSSHRNGKPVMHWLMRGGMTDDVIYSRHLQVINAREAILLKLFTLVWLTKDSAF